jgi:hypothetical protein
MRLTPLFILVLLLLSPLTAFAAEGNKLQVIPPVNPLNQIGGLSAVNGSSNLTALNQTSNDGRFVSSAVPSQTPSEYKEAPKDQKASESVGEEMIKNALSGLIVSFANMIVRGLGGVQTGQLNDSANVSGEKVAIFAVAAHTIDPTTDPTTMQDVDSFRQIYIYFVILFALLLALFLIFQQFNPHRAAQVVETVTGSYGFVGLDDMAEYYTVTCGWLLFGTGEFYAALWLNNFLVTSLMLSVLDLVSFNSENVMLYVIMVILWAVLMAFFALRLVTILIVVRLWYLLGIGLAWKRVRWLGWLTLLYMNGVIFYQFFIVWPAVTIVSYVNSHALSFFGEAFIYLGLFILELIITIIVVCWPVIIAIISPKTWRTILTVARYVK